MLRLRRLHRLPVRERQTVSHSFRSLKDEAEDVGVGVGVGVEESSAVAAGEGERSKGMIP